MIPIPSRPIVPQEVTPAGPAVVGFGVFDEVFLDKCIYKNVYNRKSLTIHHLQRRLYELGYIVALKDKDGYYGDLTRSAVAQFQADRNLAGDGLMTAEAFELIFANDPNVKVVL
jgi:peptidoglycan hydrolase-like protein with peptidoglycan-binding domain